MNISILLENLNEMDNEEITNELTDCFLKYDLQLEFKTICTKDHNSEIAFLDVLHQPRANATKSNQFIIFVQNCEHINITRNIRKRET